MKFSAVSSDLSKALSRIISVVPSKSTLPILENILFELSGNELKLSASDLEISMTLSVPVQGMHDGALAVPAKKLNETLRALPTTDVLFSSDASSHRISLKTDHGEYRMAGETAANFPATESVEPLFSMTLEGALLRDVIGKSVFAVSTDDLRPAMMGVLFQWKSGEFRSVATDGHRLVLLKHFGSLSKAYEQGDQDIIIPAKALNLILRSLDSGEVTVHFGKTNIQFAMNDLVLVSRIIDERYPNYESVIPLENDKLLEVNREALIAAVHRCAIFANTLTNQVRFSVSKEELRVSAEDVEHGGEAHESIPASFSTDEQLDIGFNSRYILDALNHLDDAEVTFYFSSSTRAGVIRPKEPPKELDILLLVMPLRLNT